MAGSEASSNIQPRSNVRKPGFVRRNLRLYFQVICFLFTVVFMLCVNNMIMYNSYKEIQKKYNLVSVKANFATEDKQNLSSEKQGLVDEKLTLQEDYNEASRQNEEILKQVNEIRKQNDELLKKNRELIEDNIALQNSLKMAASVGIKPQNYTQFEGLNSRSDIQRGRHIGSFLGTAYTPSIEECGNTKGITNSGKPIIPGISVAIDNKYWPFGTVFYIKGLGYAIAMDTGSAIKGKYRFDFSVLDKDFAKVLGTRQWDVYLVKLGKGYVEEVQF